MNHFFILEEQHFPCALGTNNGLQVYSTKICISKWFTKSLKIFRTMLEPQGTCCPSSVRQLITPTQHAELHVEWAPSSCLPREDFFSWITFAAEVWLNHCKSTFCFQWYILKRYYIMKTHFTVLCLMFFVFFSRNLVQHSSCSNRNLYTASFSCLTTIIQQFFLLVSIPSSCLG